MKQRVVSALIAATVVSCDDISANLTVDFPSLINFGILRSSLIVYEPVISGFFK